ncbi:MAG: DUF2249 domain-containing protein [Saccharofermentanales bacterium]|jgi:hypothetical protein
MSFEQWNLREEDFDVIDVRGLRGNFFPGLQKKAAGLDVGQGLKIIQSFEPHPLYQALGDLGFEHHTEKVDDNEYHVYFYRVEKKASETDMPFRPVALLNYPLIDEELGTIAADFWHLTWQSERRTLPYEMRLLLSLTNAVGAGRMRQATRELIKAYVHGVESAVLDDVFELLAWNQGIGYFSSEIGPSTLFDAYKRIKRMEARGMDRALICEKLKEEFNEKHPDVMV